MNIETTFNLGDKGWVLYDGYVKQVTVGQVSVIYRIPGSEISWGEQYREECMCIETGIGSGSVYTAGEHIFTTREACEEANKVRIAREEQLKTERCNATRKKILASESDVRRQLAQIEKLKKEDAQWLT